MSLPILAIVTALLATTTLLSSAAEACISCEYVPPVVHSGEKSPKAKHYKKHDKKKRGHHVRRKTKKSYEGSKKAARSEPNRESADENGLVETENSSIASKRAPVDQSTGEAAQMDEPAGAQADIYDDCKQTKNVDSKIRGCTQIIEREEKEAQEVRTWAFYQRAWGYGENGEHDHAIADATKAIALDPKYSWAYFERGRAYEHTGNKKLAIAEYRKAVEFDPSNQQAKVNLNALTATDVQADRYSDCDQSEDFDRSIRGCRQIIDRGDGETTQRRADAYFNRGRAHYNKGDNERAIAAYDKAIALNPKDADAYVGRGLAYQKTGDLDRAVADYDLAIALNPKYAVAYNNRGRVYAINGDNERAIADFDKAIALDPKNAVAHNNRGRAYASNGDNEHAIADFDAAIALTSKDARIYNARGDAYKKKGDKEKAIADYRKALQVDPSYQDAKNNLKALAGSEVSDEGRQRSGL